MYAIIATGGKQYKVSEGDIITIEKLGVDAGEKVTFDQVLAVSGDDMKVFDRRITFRIPFSEILVNPAMSMIHGTLSTYSKRGICVSSSLFSSPTHRYISPQRYLANAPPFKIVNTSSYFSPGWTSSIRYVGGT